MKISESRFNFLKEYYDRIGGSDENKLYKELAEKYRNQDGTSLFPSRLAFERCKNRYLKNDFYKNVSFDPPVPMICCPNCGSKYVLKNQVKAYRRQKTK